ncbi:45692014-5e91-4f64-b82f-0775447e7927 [Sclerotinia trifoliorum]|uniref:45692014-5e91-4f64-b82f-0775447e7927 n=1 Tax=Sclerotinia trifoliorum TaxID=28548 RepID=A0A8H2W0I7_9HELO|nr:45692014-5e91-4f64-b82f-0775447e7927 [Sclerotinia trifoliorum]
MALLCTVANAMLNTFEGTGYRGLATGIALVGNPTGGIIFTFVLKAVLENLEWADAMRVVAGGVGVLVAVGYLAFLPRGGSRKRGVGHRERDGDCNVSTTTTNTRNGASWWKFWHEKKIHGDWGLLRDKRFLWCMAGISLFEFVLVGTTGLLPTYALKQGFSTSVSFNVVAIVNAGSILGRLLSGPLSDHLGPYNIVLLCLVSVSLLSNFIFFLPTSTLPISSTPTSPSTPKILLYLYASLSGLGSGAIMSCAPLCISALCPSHVYARWWGASQLGVAIAYMFSQYSPLVYNTLSSSPFPLHLLLRFHTPSFWVVFCACEMGGTGARVDVER